MVFRDQRVAQLGMRLRSQSQTPRALLLPKTLNRGSEEHRVPYSGGGTG